MSKPTELVRVKDPATGAEYNASRQYAKQAGLTVLSKPVRDRYARLIPAKSDPLRSPSPSNAPATTKNAAAKAADPKES